MPRWGLLGVTFLVGCFDPTYPAAGGDGGPGGVDGRPLGCDGSDCRAPVAELPAATATRRLDLLFVVDNSSSMTEEQQALTGSFPRLVAALQGGGGGLPDLHLGVVSSDLGTGYETETCSGEGDEGILQNTARGACSPPDGRFISDVASGGGRDKNYSGSLADAFTCIAALGIDGCGIEQHLGSMKRALDGSNPENFGFLRDGSFLGVIVVADEDDCSASDTRLFDPSGSLDDIDSIYGNYTSFRCTEFGVICDGRTLPRSAGTYASCQSRADSAYLFPPRAHADFLRSLRPLTHLFVAAIAGPPSPFAVILSNGKPDLDFSCRSGSGVADPAVRLHELVDELPGHGMSVSICDPDPGARMEEIGRQLSTRLAGSCLWQPVRDVSPAAGLQPDCVVWQQVGSTRTSVPACGNGAAQPCFALVADATLCPYAPGQLRLSVQRATAAPAGATYVVECLRPL